MKQTCTACRTRKTRCDPGSGPGSSSQRLPCLQCSRHGFKCVYDQPTSHRRTPSTNQGSAPPRHRRLAPLSSSSGRSPLGKSTAPIPSHGTTPAIASRANDLDPHGFMDLVLEHYFRYLHPLTPLLDQKLFRQALAGDSNASPPADALGDGRDHLISVSHMLVTMTLSTLPWAFTDFLSKNELRDTAESHFELGRSGIMRDKASCSAHRCALLYFAHVGATLLRRKTSSQEFLGALWADIYGLNLHKEETYAALRPVDRELARRIYWLALGSDKSHTTFAGTPVFITSLHQATVPLPSPCSIDAHPVFGLAFRAVSHVFDLIGKLEEMRRANPPPFSSLVEVLDRARSLSDAIDGVEDGLARDLRVVHVDERLPSVYGSISNMLEDDSVDLVYLLRESFGENSRPSTPYRGSSQSIDTDSLDVARANVLTTLLVGQLLAAAYIHEVESLYQDGMRDIVGADHELVNQHRQRELAATRARVFDRMRALCDITPIKALAVNGRAALNKIRFVAFTVLEDLATDRNAHWGTEGPQEDGTSTQAAHDTLTKFINVLTEIERLRSLD